jgi:hypothetical protein
MMTGKRVAPASTTTPASTPAAPSQAAENVKTDSGFGKRGFKPGGKTHQSMSPGSNTGAASPPSPSLDKSGDHIQKLIEDYLGKNSGRRQKNSKKALSGIEKVKIPGWTPKTDAEKAAQVVSNERKHAQAMRDRNLDVPPGHGEAIEKISNPFKRTEEDPWPDASPDVKRIVAEGRARDKGDKSKSISPRPEKRTIAHWGGIPIRVTKSDDIDVSLLKDISDLLDKDLATGIGPGIKSPKLPPTPTTFSDAPTPKPKETTSFSSAPTDTPTPKVTSALVTPKTPATPKPAATPTPATPTTTPSTPAATPDTPEATGGKMQGAGKRLGSSGVKYITRAS